MAVKLAVILLAGLLTFGLTLLLRRHASRLGMVNEPNARTLHRTATPRGGGLAFVLSWYLGLGAFQWLGLVETGLFWALIGGLPLAVVGLIDDARGIRPVFRLLVQFAVAALALILLGGLADPLAPGDHPPLSPAILSPIALLGMVWFINLYNFMDGADGFASLQAIIIAMVLFAFSGSWTILILVAALAGFLCWNWPRAKIFMGDVGSTQLGFILVVLGIHHHNTLDLHIFSWLMLTAPFWFDATLTLYRRWRRGDGLLTPHLEHFYQRYLRAGHTHLQLNLSLLALNAVIIGLILIGQGNAPLRVLGYILTLALLYALARRIDRIQPFR